ncbi:pyridoxine 5'-phosphate synthase [Chlorobium sp. BLA1]|uniref:pyridoxine 5'-phosphate synthase n=1 Tax=Candidatus Chlorobium masyuteum TaxID=2716876 RepID=UPI001420C617|nr:pyridoxine 5'-phosphate synthase [Candidatus Chlorobium masyuteum]NHQ60109.1 pyridoxine 5'-phosphate synthase [Candidatus Chlorobium masyuteum]NTU44618.1 pyridoxine 5'-phosphate synthase [Chlorobiaceae bacterium]
MRLAVNIDHIATLRNARNEYEPDPVEAALLAEKCGAAGIVCHLREDRRHIRDLDLQRLREAVTTKLDLEMAMTPEMQQIALKTRPELITLVPEKREELTTEGGFDITRHFDTLVEFLKPIRDAGIESSIFIEPSQSAITLAAQAGAELVELHTGTYALKTDEDERETEMQRIREAASFAKSLGLKVVAGHGLNYLNIAPFKTIPEIEEVSIGHAIIARAVLSGLDAAVREMIRIIE